ILDDEDAFSNAREPLSQAFTPKDESGGLDADKTFVTISNHFKSKGSGEGPGNEDNGDGQGNSNADRVKQAKSLVEFAGEQQEAADSDFVYLLGDFNSYTQEDPMQVFYGAGFKDVASEMTDESTYVFKSRTGSLDHVLALDASGGPSAFDAISGADVWNINSVEALALEYSRFNYNAGDFYAPDQFRASDHDPVVVGLFEPDDPDGNDDAGPDDAEADAEAGAGADGGEDNASSGADSDASVGAGGSSDSAADSGSSEDNAGSDSDAGGDLPRTGLDPTLMMSIAAGLLVIGASIVLIARRRRLGGRR
ncbi:MAG: endonuclease/exonuclease/phosphatase, partial [Brevibacterium sp.]|nr:endonuclease/exonuclease/phosphatase [Brevibacterium sp.]